MSRQIMSPDAFNAFWAIVSALVLIPSAFVLLFHVLTRREARASWRRADERGRRIDREARR